MTHPRRHSRRRHPTLLVRSAGLSLIELLVAVTIGVVLIFGAAQVYVDSSKTYAINESTARLQETTRYAISVLEPDIRMANYWGLVNSANLVAGNAPQHNPDGTAATPSSLGGTAATTCGPNFGLDLQTYIEGTNNSYTATCTPFGTAMPNADTITIRRASTVLDNAQAATGPLRICSTRTSGLLVTDSTSDICTEVAVDSQINDLIVNMYYVDQTSSQAGVPSLRRWHLIPPDPLHATPDFQDQEIVPGVEDLQIQYGVDPTGGSGVTAGAATQYLDAGTQLTNLLNGTTTGTPAQIVSVRVWILARADTPEVGFSDDRVYEYGDRLQGNGTTGDLTSAADINKAYQPSLSADKSFTSVMRYRRLLISRTILIRNATGT
jgi:type IV pilus assembly protein PilW